MSAGCHIRRPNLNSPPCSPRTVRSIPRGVITDKFTGQSRGFGFVEMSKSEEAQAAISALNGSQMDGRSLTVNEAKPQEPRSGGDNRFGGGKRDKDFGNRIRF